MDLVIHFSATVLLFPVLVRVHCSANSDCMSCRLAHCRQNWWSQLATSVRLWHRDCRKHLCIAVMLFFVCYQTVREYQPRPFSLFHESRHYQTVNAVMCLLNW